MEKLWEEFARHALAWDIPLTAAQLHQFRSYYTELRLWNTRFNLTAISDPAEMIAKHFLDSLSCATVENFSRSARVVDVGSGAGFPGVPLRIAFPSIRLTVVESVGKKARFIDRLLATVGIKDAEVIQSRAEEVAWRPSYRGSFDVVVARAVARLDRLVPWLLPLAREDGATIAMKGPQAEEEVANARQLIAALGANPPVIHALNLPMANVERSLVVIRQERLSPSQWPRWGKARGGQDT